MVFCKYSVANIEIKLHFINICHGYFMLFDTEITFEMSVDLRHRVTCEGRSSCDKVLIK